MPDWRDYATPEEETRLKEIELMGGALKAEKVRIYDRCRKRMLVKER